MSKTLDKEEIHKAVQEKLREHGESFEFVNHNFVKMFVNALVDSIYESQIMEASKD